MACLGLKISEYDMQNNKNNSIISLIKRAVFLSLDMMKV